MLRSLATSLHLCGALPAGRPVVALVGARAASSRGVAHARRLAAELADGGAVILSGGALGIDSAAHEGALGRTVAVLASGLDQPYPARNAGLFREIVARGGGLVSPFPEGTPPRRWQFLHRNGVIADLAGCALGLAPHRSRRGRAKQDTGCVPGIAGDRRIAPGGRSTRDRGGRRAGRTGRDAAADVATDPRSGN